MSGPVTEISGKTRTLIVMGVAGCGKSTFGEALAHELGCGFLEGDQFHPEENVAKMSAGIALGDADRWPWLERLAEEANGVLRAQPIAIIGCSALKQRYRDRLRQRIAGDVQFVFLKGNKALIGERMAARKGHFMPTALLDSQFEALEDPSEETGVFVADIALDTALEVSRIAELIRQQDI